MEKQWLEQAEKFGKHLSDFFQIACVPVEMEENICFSNKETGRENPVCRACVKYRRLNCSGKEAFLYGIRQAFRWKEPYIFLCPLGLVLVTAYVTDIQGEITGGLAAGPMCMGHPEDNYDEKDPEPLKRVIEKNYCFSPEQIQSLGEIMNAVTENISGRSRQKQTSPVSGKIREEHKKKAEEHEFYTYPIAQERQLRMAVRHRDGEKAQIILNQILAYIYLSNHSDLKRIRPRIVELLTVISRAAADAGADINEMMQQTDCQIHNMNKISSIEELSIWLSRILQQFIENTFGYDFMKHKHIIDKVTSYIDANYDKRLSLDEIAGVVYVGKSYLSSLFKKETGQSITSYINQIRIENSKILLMDTNLSVIEITHRCGFDNQSYFTRIFREVTGVTPKKYRDKGVKE